MKSKFDKLFAGAVVNKKFGKLLLSDPRKAAKEFGLSDEQIRTIVICAEGCASVEGLARRVVMSQAIDMFMPTKPTRNAA